MCVSLLPFHSLIYFKAISATVAGSLPFPVCALLPVDALTVARLIYYVRPIASVARLYCRIVYALLEIIAVGVTPNSALISAFCLVGRESALLRNAVSECLVIHFRFNWLLHLIADCLGLRLHVVLTPLIYK